jgi:hypothetical protein
LKRIRQRPGSLALLHSYAKTLAKIGDPHAREWLDKLGNTYHAQTWPSSSELEEAQRKARAPAIKSR